MANLMKNNFGRNNQNMALIQETCRPIWKKFLNDYSISENEAENNDWDFITFCDEVALDLRIADQRN